MPLKKCPYCAEEIQDTAIKCRYCNEWLDGRAPTLFSKQPSTTPVAKKTGLSTGAIVVLLLTIGPFALPFVWSNPRYKRSTKIIITIIVILVTVLLCYLFWKLFVFVYTQVQKVISDAKTSTSLGFPSGFPKSF